MDKKMDERGYKAVDIFLAEVSKNGQSSTTCPYCKTKLQLLTRSTSYEVKCRTENCLKETFRGI